MTSWARVWETIDLLVIRNGRRSHLHAGRTRRLVANPTAASGKCLLMVDYRLPQHPSAAGSAVLVLLLWRIATRNGVGNRASRRQARFFGAIKTVFVETLLRRDVTSALTQMLVHFHFFLHLGIKGNREDMLLIVFSALLLTIMVAGTIWIMASLARRMGIPG